MIKILHSADWHLDSAMAFRSPEQTQLLRRALSGIPGQIASLCKDHGCDLMLLSGDLFDGPCTADSVQILRDALEDAAVPVFIAPGNHDPIGGDSPWLSVRWPANVHIFTHPVMESVVLPELDCRVYGAGFTGMDCPGLLANFHAAHTERYAVGILHGDPTQAASPYCPITTEQVKQSGLDYLALGHIHKGDSFRAGNTLCAWPGCPMGRGYDEQGEKGVLLVTLDDTADAQFLPLNTPRFYDVEIPADRGLDSILPPVGSDDFYRITFTGAGDPPDLAALQQEFSRFPNLHLRDRTVPPVDIWGTAGADTLEGMYFSLLRTAMDTGDEDFQRQVRLAAQISRQILDGQEVVLP